MTSQPSEYGLGSTANDSPPMPHAAPSCDQSMQVNSGVPTRYPKRAEGLSYVGRSVLIAPAAHLAGGESAQEVQVLCGSRRDSRRVPIASPRHPIQPRIRAATASGVSPNSAARRLAGADAPKRSMPRFSPHTAVRRSQPKVDPASSEAPGQALAQHREPVGLVLGEEGLPAGQAHHPQAPPLGGQQVGGGQRQRDLRAGGQQHRVGAVAHDVAAALHPALLAGAVEHRQVLAAEHQGGGAVVAVERQLPGLGGLPGVGGAHHPEVGDGPQGGQVLDGLMGGAVLPQQHRVVGEHEDARRLHQGRQADRRAQVVAEDHEGGAVGAQAAVDRQAVHHGPHGELPHPEAEVAPRRGGRLEVGRPGDQGVVGGRQVGRAAHEAGQPRRQGVDHLPGGGAGGDRLAHLEARHRAHLHPARRPVCLPAGGGLRVGGEAAVAALLPGLAGGSPAGHALAGRRRRRPDPPRSGAPPASPWPAWPRRSPPRPGGSRGSRPNPAWWGRRRRCGCGRRSARAATRRPGRPRRQRPRPRGRGRRRRGSASRRRRSGRRRPR